MRKVLRDSAEVMHIFAQQNQEEGKCCNVYFYKKDLYSYGSHYILARFISADNVLVSTKPYSVTTVKHIHQVRHALFHKNRIYVYMINYSFEDNFLHYESEIKNNLFSASKAVTKKDYYLSCARSNYEEFINYCKYVYPVGKKHSLNKLKKLIDNIDLSKYKLEIKRQKEKYKLKQLEKEKEEKDTIEKWKNGEISYFPYIIDKVFLRVKNEEVQTSKGAHVSLYDARILYAMIEGKRDIIGHNIGNYTVVSYRDGVLKIGCHYIPQSEINRISHLLK